VNAVADQAGDGAMPKIYPNPATDLVDVAMPADMRMKTFTLFNAQGIPLASGSTFPIDLHPYPRGIYFLEITTTQTRFRSKLMLNAQQ
jgi:hypothetical protein